MQCQFVKFVPTNAVPKFQLGATNAVPNFLFVAANYAVPKFQLGAATAVPNFQFVAANAVTKFQLGAASTVPFFQFVAANEVPNFQFVNLSLQMQCQLAVTTINSLWCDIGQYISVLSSFLFGLQNIVLY